MAQKNTEITDSASTTVGAVKTKSTTPKGVDASKITTTLKPGTHVFKGGVSVKFGDFSEVSDEKKLMLHKHFPSLFPLKS